MGKEKATTTASVFQELFLAYGSYKPSQGRLARMATRLAIWTGFGAAAFSCYVFVRGNFQSDLSKWIPYPEIVLAGAVAAVGAWVGYRLVNWAPFADFLIAVEAEMSKVSWPQKSEVIRSSMVVIFLLLMLSAILFGFDALFQFVFEALRIVRK